MKLVSSLVLGALAFAAVTDASSFRRAEACDGGDPEPTPAPTSTPVATTVTPVTTVPATTAPATTVPATTTPVTTAPATTTPAPDTTAPATTTPATTTPATTTPTPDTTAPATTTPATTTPATTTPAPDTTAPATTAPATTTPATTTPAPDTTAPATTAPATTTPATTTPAPDTTAPATTTPATTAPATTAPTPAWDLNTPYDRSGVDCTGLLRVQQSPTVDLVQANCVKDSGFSFFNGVDVVQGCVVCAGTYDVSLTLAPFPLCNNKPICGRIGDYTDLTQGEVACVIKANGSQTALAACKLGSNAVTPAPTTTAPAPSTPAPVTPEPATTTPSPTYPVTPAPVPSAPASYDWDTAYDLYNIDCYGNTKIGSVGDETKFSADKTCVKQFSYYNGQQVRPACLVCDKTYDATASPPLCAGKPICGRIGEYTFLTQKELKCVVDANGDVDVVSKCTLADNY